MSSKSALSEFFGGGAAGRYASRQLMQDVGFEFPAAAPISESRPTKRRGRREIEGIEDAIYAALLEDKPMTVRQVFYRLVSNGVIGKTEAEYKSTVVRLLGKMRRSGVIPFSWIADNTRWMRKPRTYSSLESMLQRTVEAYRRSVWDNQECYVEIWLEKDALAGVLYQETMAWDVPLMVTRGYPSLSYLHSAAEAIAAQDKLLTFTTLGTTIRLVLIFRARLKVTCASSRPVLTLSSSAWP